MQGQIQIIPIQDIKEVELGDNLAQLILNAIDKQGLKLKEDDIVVITQKIVSKAEGRVINLSTVNPSPFAEQIAKKHRKDPRYIELVLSESKSIIRMTRGIIISETYHGYICANAGVDASNAGTTNAAALLPKNPDNSAKSIKEELEKKGKIKIGVIISDTWGRPWREGQVNFAIGSSGLEVLTDYKGVKDKNGYELKVSLIAVADELASAAELTMGKINGVPVAIIRGYRFKHSIDGSKPLLRDSKKDIFR